MTIVLPEVISEAIYTYGMFDETVTWMALKAVKPGDLIFDVGAHFGYFSLLFAHLAGAKGRVFAFEPTPSTYDILEANVKAKPNIKAVNCAAGDTNGKIAIADFGLKHSAWNTLAAESRMPDTLQAEQSRRIPVDVIPLDVFAAQQHLTPDFIKIDAENFEHAVVAGLEAVINQARPAFLLEAGSQSASLAIHKILQTPGYRLYVSDGPGSLYQWTRTAEEANSSYKDILLAPAHRLPI